MIRKSIPSCRWVFAAAGIVVFSMASEAFAETYQVGPGKPFRELSEVARLLAPGDVVEVEGNAIYAGDVAFSKHGSPDAKITIRGIPRNGKRPTISGGTNTIAVHANHYVLEGIDVTGGSFRCIFHHGNDLTVRDSVVHDCAGHGVLGADTESGSLLLERVEVHHCGEGTRKHQIYVATDEKLYPNAVFRMEHSYVHDGNGGNNVKSRAGRNEIYYNWIEGAAYHELELIGSQEFPENLVREDSDIVGNVLRKTTGSNVTRFGGDGAGQTNGRYRFVNNTVIVNGSTKNVFRLFDGIESVEVHNNVFTGDFSGPITLVRDAEARWSRGHAIFVGSNNWVPTGTKTPAAWSNTQTGDEPGFSNAMALDFTPRDGSPLQNAGDSWPQSPVEAPIQMPLKLPSFVPPPRKIVMPAQRPNDGVIDIGAMEVTFRRASSTFEETEETVAMEESVEDDELPIEEQTSSCSLSRGSSKYVTANMLTSFLMGLVMLGRRRFRGRLAGQNNVD